MNKRLLLISALLAIFSFNCLGQRQVPIKNVPSPEIAGLGEYGRVPVSLYTGVPDISVPIYELNAGGYSLSLFASYHLASVKPNSQSGCLGLGWNLIAGGYITRSVRGTYDEKCESNGYAPGYYAHASKLKNISNEQFEAETMHIQNAESNYYELTADEFSFNVSGYSGNFYYGGDGEWHVISDQDIRVEFNSTDGEGFVSLSEVGKRLDVRSWGASTRNNRFYNKFALITPDGCRYEFGGVNATEYSIPYYARYNSDLIATTWRLSKITTVDKRVIEFSYDTSAIMCDLRYVPQQKVVTNVPCSYNGIQRGRSGMTGYLLFPVNLKTIRTPNEILEFNYYNEYGYGDNFVDGYLAWTDYANYDWQDIYNMNFEDPANQFTLFLGNQIDNTNHATLRQSIKSKLKHKILHCIYVKGKNSRALKTIYFDYVKNNRIKLALITERPGNPDLIPNYVWHPHGYHLLTWYNVPENLTGGRVPEYRFLYNSEKHMPNDYVRPEVDSWGYYTGGSVEFAAIPDFSHTDSNLQYTLAEVLTEIIYPTGGKSRFEYQLNNYSKMVAPSLTSLTDIKGTAGGLRIQRVTNMDKEDNVLGSKKYYYSNTRDQYGESSGILKSFPVNEVAYTIKNRDKESDPKNSISLYFKSKGGYCASVTNLNTPDVGYSCVIEETFDKDNKSQGYIVRRYSNYDMDIYGDTHYDERAFYSMLEGDFYTIPFSSRSMERGKLLSEEYYSNTNFLRKKVNYRYKEVNPGSFVTADQMVLLFCADLDNSMFQKVGTLTRTYTHSYLNDSVIETLYPQLGNMEFVVKKAYQYNKYKQLSRVIGKNSDGRKTLTEYVYAATLPEYGWMEEAHILSPISSKKEQTGDSFLKEVYQYKGPMPYLKQISTDRNGYKHKHYEVEATDNYGNPIYLHEESMLVVLIWGGEGQRLISRIENATLSQVEEALGMNVKDFSLLDISAINFQKVENIRHKIFGTHFYIYKYTNDLRLLSETKPNGITVFYKYDFLGRLIESYVMELENGDYQKRILNIYDYNYYYGFKVESEEEILERGGQL
ncbi:YD repeat-containing protein [Bacteroides reticulotermitis]|nr:hypothetical protein [Bacteroides reticulotermitis]MBB4044503.1 YD repeat-containing protein [Bacteroides reticulotermitis]